MMLGDVVTLKRGHDLPETQRVEGDVPVVSSSGITGSHNEPKAAAPGVVTGRYGTLGEVFYLDQDYWPLNTALYVTDFKGNDPRFVAYFLRNALRDLQGDKAAVPGVNRNVLHALEVQSPDPQTQERIATILSGYDDSVANNQRRIELLEEAASQLYSEWFPRFRFPGYEHTPVTDGIPQDWEKRPLARCAKFLSGGTPSKQRSDYWDGDIPWVSSGEMTVTRLYDTEHHISEEAARAGSNVVPPGTILMVVRGMSLAKESRIAVTTVNMAFNQDLKALVCKPGVDSSFLAHALLAERSYIRDLASDAAHGTKRLETPVLECLPVLVPPVGLQALFRDSVAPFDALRDKLHEENAKLTVVRDMLAPRLLSGQLRV